MLRAVDMPALATWNPTSSEATADGGDRHRAGGNEHVVHADDVVAGEVDAVVDVPGAVAGVHDDAADGERLPGIGAGGDVHVRNLEVRRRRRHLHRAGGLLHVV